VAGADEPPNAPDAARPIRVPPTTTPPTIATIMPVDIPPLTAAPAGPQNLVGAQNLVHILSGPYGIVPAAKQFVGNEVELAHCRV
jgi:hypothetical protein